MASFEQLGRQARQAIKAALEPGERIEAAIAGASGSALVATNRRVFIFKKGATTGTLTGRQLNSWDYSNISGVEYKSTITTQGVVLQVPGVVPVTKFTSFTRGPRSVWEAPNALMLGLPEMSSRAKEPIAVLRRLIADHQSHETRRPDPIEQVRRLAELRDEGILTEEEFQRKKRELLDL
jgi:hypothetical protein